MRHMSNCLLIAALALSACTLTPASPRGKIATSASSRTVAASPSPTPAVPMAELQGTLRIDAAYVLANRAGQVISNNGSSVLQVGAAIVSNNGSGLISDNGLGAVGNGGAGSRYRVAADLAVGTLLPAAGMEVVAVNLLDGQPLGAPVASDASGRFKVSVPRALAGNTLLQARVPDTTDARMHYDVLTKAGQAAEAVVDEDEAALARFLRRVYAGKVEELILRGKAAMGEGGSFYGMAEANPIVAGVLNELIAAIEAARLKELPEARRHALAQRVCDILLYHVDLEDARTDPTEWKGPEEPATGAMRESLKLLREAAAERLQADARFFERQPYMLKANQEALAAGKPPFEIKKPTDLNDFVVEHIFVALVGDRTAMLSEVALSVGGTADQVARFSGASYGILNTVGLTLVVDAEAKAAILEAIRAAR